MPDNFGGLLIQSSHETGPIIKISKSWSFFWSSSVKKSSMEGKGKKNKWRHQDKL